MIRRWRSFGLVLPLNVPSAEFIPRALHLVLAGVFIASRRFSEGRELVFIQGDGGVTTREAGGGRGGGAKPPGT